MAKRRSVAMAVMLGALALAGCGRAEAPQTGASTTTVLQTSTTSTAATTKNLAMIAFLSPTTGYGVFEEQGPGGCQDLVGPTTNGGSTFTALVPVTSWSCGSSAPVQALAFDDHGDGFLYGPELFVSHDGGSSWAPDSQPDAVLAVQALGSSVWMLESGCPTTHPGTFGPCHLRLLESTDGGRTWGDSPPLPAGAIFNGNLSEAALGQTWLVARRPILGLCTVESRRQWPGTRRCPTLVHQRRRDLWSTRNIPCAIGALSVVLSAAPDGTLLAVCASEPGAGNQAKSAVRSTDGGLTWTTESSCSPGVSPPANCVAPLSSGYLGEIDATSSEKGFSCR